MMESLKQWAETHPDEKVSDIYLGVPEQNLSKLQDSHRFPMDSMFTTCLRLPHGEPDRSRQVRLVSAYQVPS